MELLEECTEKMDRTIDSFKSNLATIRTGRVSPVVLDRLTISYYGEETPIKNVAGIQSPSATQLLIKPFDPTCTKLIQQAIGESDLGVNPQVDGNCIRLNFPSLTTERRDEFAKQARKYAEEAKVAIRNIRRDYNSAVKKDKTLSEDMAANLNDDIQEVTDGHIKSIETVLAAKEKEIYTI